jgi:lipopolysaccharide transport system permease protein
MNSTKGKTQGWDIEITPVSSLFEIKLGELWHYRDLLGLLVRRDFVAFYKQTILGPLWFFIQPIFTTIIFTLIFSNLAGISTDGIPPPLFYLSGSILWNYFSECLTKTSTVFRENANIFGKVYFPRLIMPLSIVISNLIKFTVQLLLFVFVYIWYYFFQGANVEPNIYVLLFPIIVILMAMQGLGLGLIITALTTKYRDLAFLVAFGVQLLMYATPVVYPLSAAPTSFRKLIELNPLSGLIETCRFGFLGSGKFYTSTFLYSLVASVLLFVIGVVIFNKVEKDFVDTV